MSCQGRDPVPQVMAVYPSADTLPENLLRMYVLFSGPMKTAGNLDRIKLFNDSGEELSGVFFNNVYELWNAEQTQLTLILDPARVKTGLEAYSKFGHALVPGTTYRLEIDGLEDIYHRVIPAPFIKEFIVDEADAMAPNSALWDIGLPLAGTKEALTIEFPESLDWFSLQRRLVIVDEQQHLIQGEVAVKQAETQWIFQPRTPWALGNYQVVVNARLEDPSGNNLNGVFDHVIGSLNYEREGEILYVPFEITN